MKREVFEIPKSKHAGIYMLYNMNKHKAYIGATKNFHARAMQHRSQLIKNAHSNKGLQKDFNNGCEFCFVILETVTNNDDDYLFKREKQYIYAFKDKSAKVYNHETMKQLERNLFYDFVEPLIKEIQTDMREKLDCHIMTLERCGVKTLKEKFTNMNGMKEACDAALKILKEVDQEEKGE